VVRSVSREVYPMPESSQHKLDRIRPPRVHITYDVEVGGSTDKKELPLVIGVLADLSGKPEQPLPKLKQRGFVEIDKDNFDDVMASIAPRLSLGIESQLSPGDCVKTELQFRSMDDFEPANIVNQVPALRRLLEARSKLSDLLAKLDGNDDLEGLLQQIASDTGTLKQIQAEGQSGPADPPEGSSPQ
jgi:type VI secretion system protein ImpB